MFRLILILSCTFLGVLSATFGPKCQLSAECITKHTKDIYKSVLEDHNNQLDPLHQELIEGNLATLKYTVTNITTTGFRKCSVTFANLDLKALEFKVQLSCPEFNLKGLYDIHGSFISVPIDGNGEFNVVTKTYNIHIRSSVSVSHEGNKNYLHVNNFDAAATNTEGVVFNFTNVLYGQEELVDQLNKFVNENWKAVSKELQEPVLIANLEKIFKAANQFFKTRPLEDFLLM